MSHNGMFILLSSIILTATTGSVPYYSGVDLFIGLFNNLALFIVLVAFYKVLMTYISEKKWYKQQLVLGIVFGLFVFGCMQVKIPVARGVVVDQRNAIVILSGWFGGPLSAFVTAFFAVAYRFYLGGEGVVGGIFGIFLSAIAGSTLYRIGKKTKTPLGVVISALVSTIFILPGFMIIGPLASGLALVKKMFVPYGSAIFLGISIGAVLFIRENRLRLVEAERKQVIRDLKKLLDEKVILLREIHHRVKNNMQVIIALLSLQMEQSDSSITPILNEVVNRIQVFSDIHRNLYNYGDVSQINFIKHLEHHFANLKKMYCHEECDVSIKLDMSLPLIDLDTAIPVGLLMNELMTNSFKHSITENGEIRITIDMLSKSRIQKILYSDNGKTIDNFQAGFGAIIIDALSEQLELEHRTLQGSELKHVFSSKTNEIGMGKGTILIVEKEMFIDVDKVRRLKEAGFFVDENTFTSGEEALQYYKSLRVTPSLIIMGIGLSGSMGGLELAKEIHQIDSTMPIIFICGNEGPDIMKKITEIPNALFLNKTCSIAELIVAIGEVGTM